MTIRSTRVGQYGRRGAARLATLVTLAAALLCPTAHAQTGRNVTGAAEAFTKGQQAELRGEFQEAATAYARADELAPAAEALRSAARTAQKAGMNATAATYAALLQTREQDAASQTLAEEILGATAADLTRLHVTCNVECRVLIDGRITASRLTQDHVLYARPGSRTVAATFDAGTVPAQTANLVPGASAEFSFVAPLVQAAPLVASTPVEPASQPAQRTKLSPWYFGTVGTLTLVAGGLTAWSAVKVKNAHDDYDRSGPDAQKDYDDGRKLEKQTNALIGVTSGLAVATVALAFFTDFKGKEGRSDRDSGIGQVSMSATRQGAWLGLKRSF